MTAEDIKAAIKAGHARAHRSERGEVVRLSIRLQGRPEIEVARFPNEAAFCAVMDRASLYEFNRVMQLNWRTNGEDA